MKFTILFKFKINYLKRFVLLVNTKFWFRLNRNMKIIFFNLKVQLIKFRKKSMELTFHIQFKQKLS